MKVSLALVDQNPLRDFNLNPLNQEQVVEILASVRRQVDAGHSPMWATLPARKVGYRYQIAAGHHRIEALRQFNKSVPQKERITDIELTVAKLDDWQMFVIMRDENETQQGQRPPAVMETVNAGAGLLERILIANDTFEGFCEVMQVSTAPAGTVKSGSRSRADEQHWAKARQGALDGTGFGQSFFQKYAGTKRSHDFVSTVLENRYAKRKAEVAKAQAAAAKAEEKSARASAAAEQDADKAAKLREKADRLHAEAEAFEAEIKKIAGRTFDVSMLMEFDSPTKVTAFVAAVKEAGIPKASHQAAFDLVVAEAVAGSKMRTVLSAWWYRVSGKQNADDLVAERERFRKKHTVSVDDFTAKLREEMRELTKHLKAHTPAVLQIESSKLSSNVQADASELSRVLGEWFAAFEATTEREVRDNPRRLTHQS